MTDMYLRHPSYPVKSERVKARFDNVTFDLIPRISDQMKMSKMRITEMRETSKSDAKSKCQLFAKQFSFSWRGCWCLGSVRQSLS